MEAAHALAGWYALHARDLPWRRAAEPYFVLVSEFMLQQTTVETVAPYFARFIAAFPTVRALADAEAAAVLALWSGLGYYRRARSLHEAARVIVRDHSGRVPDDAAGLRSLPGVGPYTASALLAIAFGRPELALDGNLKRVLARLIGSRVDPATKRGEDLLRAAGEEIVRAGDPSTVNQALMDLGATLCAPRAPRCLLCPLSGICEARRLGAVTEIPAAKKRPDSLPVALAAVVARRGEKLLMRRRGGELMAGMWEFPMVAADGPPGDPRAALAEIERVHRIGFSELRAFASLRHNITRHRIRVDVFEGRMRGRPAPAGEARGRRVADPGRARHPAFADLTDAASAAEFRWQPEAKLADLPLTGIARKIVRALQGRAAKGERG